MKLIKLVAIAQDNKAFFIVYTALWLLGLYPLLAWDKVTLLLMINGQHHPALDQFFYYITNLGSGITYTLLLITLLLLRVANRKLLIGASSFVVMSAIVQFLKRIGFSDQLRPIELVPDPTQLHLVGHVAILSHLSFPSGHAATIFTAACLLNLITPIKHIVYSILLLLIATIVAYSRVYLCQHFYTDVYVGMLIGGLVTTFMYAWLIDWQVPSWLEQRLPVKL
jgi:membrane-associated phospholipid phosphatase